MKLLIVVFAWLGCVALMCGYHPVVACSTLAVGMIVAALMVRVKIVKENTAIAFEFMGRFVYFAMESKGRHFELDGQIEQGPGRNYYGSCWAISRVVGWVFYLRPFVEPAKYSDYNEEDGFGEGVRVRLGDIMLEPFTPKAETKAPENIPLDVKFVAAARIRNPYKWLYGAPKDVRKKAVKKLNSLLRAWVRIGYEDHAQSARGDGDRLYSELVAVGPNAINGKTVLDQILNDWGLEIVENNIIVEDVVPDPEHQKSLQAARNAKLQADASVEETAGRVLRSVARTAGVDVGKPNELAKFMKMLRDNPTLRGKPAADGGFKEAFAYAEDQAKRDRAGGGLEDVRIGSVDGSPLPGSLQYLSVGGGGNAGVLLGGKRSKRENRGGGDRKPLSEMTEEERQELADTYRRKGR